MSKKSNPTNGSNNNATTKQKRVRINKKDNTLHFQYVMFTDKEGYVWDRLNGKLHNAVKVYISDNGHVVTFSNVSEGMKSVLAKTSVRETSLGSYYSLTDTLHINSTQYLNAITVLVDAYHAEMKMVSLQETVDNNVEQIIANIDSKPETLGITE